MNFFNVLAELLEASGFAALTWQNIAMILVSFVLFYLAIVKKFEPLLLLWYVLSKLTISGVNG